MSAPEAVREPFGHPTPRIEDIIAKLKWGSESREWSVRILPEEAALLLKILSGVPLGSVV